MYARLPSASSVLHVADVHCGGLGILLSNSLEEIGRLVQRALVLVLRELGAHLLERLLGAHVGRRRVGEAK